MTKELRLRSLDIPSIHKVAVGFDSMFDEWMKVTQSNSNYPPYNIVKHSDNQFSIEVAVAGFDEGEVDVMVENQVLTVKGQQKEAETEKVVDYLHRGISARNFVRSFTLADHVEVVGAKVKNGILEVSLERVVPEEEQPKKIAITYTK